MLKAFLKYGLIEAIGTSDEQTKPIGTPKPYVITLLGKRIHELAEYVDSKDFSREDLLKSGYKEDLIKAAVDAGVIESHVPKNKVMRSADMMVSSATFLNYTPRAVEYFARDDAVHPECKVAPPLRR